MSGEHVHTYDIGDRVGASATFLYEGHVVDPTTVTCSSRAPSGLVADHTVARIALGVYRALIDVNEWGEWYYRFDGEGAVIAAEEGRFVVRRRRVG